MTASPGEGGFAYNLTVRLDDVASSAAGAFPGIHEMSVNSRTFDDYVACISSCKAMVDDLATDLNSHCGADRYMGRAEVNPSITAMPTLSEDWDEAEIARIWVYDRKYDGTESISAVAQAKIFSVEADGPPVLN